MNIFYLYISDREFLYNTRYVACQIAVRNAKELVPLFINSTDNLKV